MRAASGPLIALLNSGTQFCVADLLTITLASGTVTRLTSADVDLTAVSQVDGLSHVFLAGLPFTRGGTKLSLGLEVDTMQVIVKPDPLVHTLGGVPWGAAAQRGALDEARVVLERAFMATWGDVSAGTILLFAGRVGQAIATRTTVTIPVNSDLELLRASMPRNAYQPGCVHTLFDAGCGLARASFAVSGTVIAGSTLNALALTDAHATGYFDLGTVVFLTGANAGQSRTVKSWTTGGTLVPAQAFQSIPQAGDTVTLYPGCDKLQGTCSGKFANLTRFRGYPFIPSAESSR